MSEKIEVSKIEIKIGDKIIPLTLDQAKELKEILNETFPEKEIVVTVPMNPIFIEKHYPPYYWWEKPYYYSADGTSQYTLQIECKDDNNF